MKVESRKVSSIKSLINWKGINYSAKVYDLKTFKKNNPTAAHIIKKIKIKTSWRFLLFEFVYILLQQKINLNLMKKYVKIKIYLELQCHQKKIIY